MEQQIEQVPAKKASQKRESYLKKIDPESAKLLAQLRERANKKAYGRKVKEREILAVAIRNVTIDHLLTLQDATYSERDRLQMAHDEFVKAHGKITLDQFIGKLMRGEFAVEKRSNS